eukprot:TRINITY_DN33349_c0_g1_i1.p1 TRINITY_DN33349_c0_g1~~TRINITY_DN33349_c0_g1_i1.p1  ORF type:complete len:208 (-),score=39.07 TRINITY_DN33349_c0_g1_i1:578-1201(-)
MGTSDENGAQVVITMRLLDRLRGKAPPPPKPRQTRPSPLPFPLPFPHSQRSAPGAEDEGEFVQRRLDGGPLSGGGGFLGGGDGRFGKEETSEGKQKSEREERLERELAPARKIIEEAKQVSADLEQKRSTEAQKVREMADELHRREYRAPAPKPLQCGPEREACLKCYLENKDNTLRCAKVVDVFIACADKVREEFLQNSSPRGRTT